MVYGIIAAGLGSRLAGDGYPGFKPMVEIQGETLIARLIRIFNANDATAIRLILNTSQQSLGSYIQGLASNVRLEIVYKDTPSSFHSFHALIQPATELEEICISTIDPIFKEEAFEAYISAFKAQKSLDGLMAVSQFVNDDAPLHVHVNSQMDILEFSGAKRLEQTSPIFVSGGIYCLRKNALNLAAPAMASGVQKMRNYQQELASHGLRLKAYDLGKIIDIDHLSDIPLAEQLLTAPFSSI